MVLFTKLIPQLLNTIVLMHYMDLLYYIFRVHPAIWIPFEIKKSVDTFPWYYLLQGCAGVWLVAFGDFIVEH